MFQGRPVRQSSASKIFLKFEGVNAFDRAGARVGYRVYRDGGAVTGGIWCLEVGLCFLDGGQARAMHRSKCKLLTYSDGLFAGVLGDVSARVEIIHVSVIRDVLARDSTLGGIVDLDHEVWVS
jgi:hypothetical protein